MALTTHPAEGGDRPRRRRNAAGRLTIGDEWMAIQIIARSQTNPQKAVAELVENSIDAGAKRIIITRARRRGRVYLRISDDGRGVPLTPDGVPDFDYVATHICDSLKRRLDERERSGIQGEFGIGLLGFWSIGRELEMISQTGDALPWVMTMRSGSRSYDRRRYLGARPGNGVDVTIHDVHREAQSRLTAEKLQRYLGEELRERIRRAGATIVLDDRLPPRRTLEARPAAFQGERIQEIAEIPVKDHPAVRAELYLAPREREPRDGEPRDREPRNEGERPVVSLYRLGTRVCRDLSALPEFAREPWSSGGIEGVVDFADLRLGPASREGFIPDGAYHAFVEGMRGVEPSLVERLRLEEEARSERASRALVKELQSAFARLLRDLPSGDYDWFGMEGRRPFAGGGDGRPGGASAVPGGEGPREPGAEGTAPPEDAAAERTEDVDDSAVEDERPPEQPSLMTGPLDHVFIRPATIRMAVGRRKRVVARAYDAAGMPIRSGLTYAWTLSSGGVGALSVVADGEALIEAGRRPARGTLGVRVRGIGGEAEARECAAEAEVLVEAEAPRRAFPPPDFVHAPGEGWRSRWNLPSGRVEVNSAHPDYHAVRQQPARRRRYLGRLYAKELVLHNFGHETTSVALERLLEVLTRLDEHL